MKAKFKTALIGVLFACAIFSAAYASVGFVKAEKSSTTAAECMTGADTESYILKEYEGHVAIYSKSNPSSPITVTDIQVSTLRDMDKNLLKTGIELDSRERLMMTLEDLGS